MWLGCLATPWRAWSTAERLDGDPALSSELNEVTALVPARDEAGCIEQTLRNLAAQGDLAQIILIDDQSSDGTAALARSLELPNLTVIDGTTPPSGWSGKLWALEQGARHASTRFVLLLDADIELAQGTVRALLAKLLDSNLTLASLMASLYMGSLWERLLLPPFIFFFKLLYPFKLANRPESRVAAAAGGCILLERSALEGIGGFESLRHAIIDDCTLAAHIKRAGGRTWLGLTRSAKAIRPYTSLENIWNMVARTAFTQLRYSAPLLALCTVLLLLSFIAPLYALVFGNEPAQVAAGVALLAMFGCFLPTVRYYGLTPLWTATLPVAASLFLAMTWSSAWRYWRGERSRWKNRSYSRDETLN